MDKKITVLGGGAGESERRYQLHLEERELNLISSLLNSVDDQRAVPLRQVVNKEVRGNTNITLLIASKIQLCGQCQGSRKVKIKNAYYEEELHTCTE